MKKKYSEEETVTEEPVAMKYEGTGDHIKVGDKEIELYPGDKIVDTGAAFVFFKGANREETDSFASVKPSVDRDAFDKFKGMNKTREVSTGILVYE